jgi:tetratricopeptide (TPR) repeat protein
MKLPRSVRYTAAAGFGRECLLLSFAAGLMLPSLCSQAGVAGVDSYLQRARELEQKERYSDAEQVYREGLSALPDNPELQKRLAVLYQTQLRFPESVALLRKVLAKDPTYAEANFYLGLSFFGMNQYAEAAASLEKELETNPSGRRRTRYYLAQVYQAQERNLNAIEQLELLVRDYPDDTRALYQLARLYKAGSILAVDRLSAIDRESVLLLALRAESHFESGQYGDAVRDYEELLRRDPKFPGVHLELGQSHWKLQQLEPAEAELRKALSEDPNHPLANYYLAEILVKKERHREALPLLEASLAGDPRSLPTYLLLAKCQTAAGQLDRARELLVRAAELAPGERAVHYQLSRLYARMGDQAASRRELEIVEQLSREKKTPAGPGIATDRPGTP